MLPKGAERAGWLATGGSTRQNPGWTLDVATTGCGLLLCSNLGAEAFFWAGILPSGLVCWRWSQVGDIYIYTFFFSNWLFIFWVFFFGGGMFHGKDSKVQTKTPVNMAAFSDSYLSYLLTLGLGCWKIRRPLQIKKNSCFFGKSHVFFLRLPNFGDLSQESYVAQVSLMPKYKSKQSLGF